MLLKVHFPRRFDTAVSACRWPTGRRSIVSWHNRSAHPNRYKWINIGSTWSTPPRSLCLLSFSQTYCGKFFRPFNLGWILNPCSCDFYDFSRLIRVWTILSGLCHHEGAQSFLFRYFTLLIAVDAISGLPIDDLNNYLLHWMPFMVSWEVMAKFHRRFLIDFRA